MQKLTNQELERLTVEEFKNVEKLPVFVVLDNVRSGLNVGSVFRSCDAFRVAGVYCCGITPCPPNRDVLKSALGATESIIWKQFPDTISAIAELRNEGYKIAAVEQTVNSVMLHQLPNEFTDPTALIFGHEMDGVSQEVIQICDFTIEVPQAGTKHSLNIAVCAGIVLWEIFRKQVKKH
jgi:23S rRNA (guanosine2251-2'-O)-methyltransferase